MIAVDLVLFGADAVEHGAPGLEAGGGTDGPGGVGREAGGDEGVDVGGVGVADGAAHRPIDADDEGAFAVL